MAGVAGFEPTNARVKVWCLTAWRHPSILLSQDFPDSIAWLRGPDLNRRPSGYEPDELPLLHPASRVIINGGQGWIRTIVPRGTDLQSVAFNHSATYPLFIQLNMATPIGIEPTISCVTGRHVNRYTTGPRILVGDDRFELPTSCL